MASPLNQSPGSDKHLLAGQAWYVSRTPMLLVNRSGILVEMNAACRQLFGLQVAGSKGRHFSHFEGQVWSDCDGTPFPDQGVARRYFAAAAESPLILRTEDLTAAIGAWRFQSDQFGDVRLRNCELPCVDAGTGVCTGSSLSLEIMEIRSIVAFRESLDRLLRHELTWDVYASSYDRILPHLTFYQEVVERHVAAFSHERQRLILDVGAGTGTVTLRLLAAGKHVTAVDVCRGMLDRLTAKIPHEFASRLTVIEDTAERLPHFEDESFDGVNVLLSLFDMTHPRAALGEAERVLKPGGVLAITEPRQCFNVEQLMQAAEADLAAQGLFPRLMDDWQRIQSVAPRMREFIAEKTATDSDAPVGDWNAEVVRELLINREFNNVSFLLSHLGNCATITGTKAIH